MKNKQFKFFQQPFTDHRGLSLIEVLIALVIFSVGILGVAMMQVRSTAAVTTAGNVSANVAVSVDQIEKLLTLDYNDSRLASGNIVPLQSADQIDNDEDGLIDENNETGFVTLFWSVSEVTPKAGSDLYSYKTVTVTVNRKTPYGNKFMTLQRNIPNIVGD